MNDARAHVLIVDDNATNLDLLVATLRAEYRLSVAKSGEKALQQAQEQRPDLILLDVMMPGMDGFQVCQALKARAQTSDIPVIFITAMHTVEEKNRGFELGAVDYITKPFHALEVQARVRTHLALATLRQALADHNRALERQVAEKTVQLQQLLEATLEAMSRMIETRDPYTAGHQQRVAQLAVALARLLGMAQHQITALRYAGLLHDIGKIRIPVSILNRMGNLLPAERDMIKSHCQAGYDILSRIPFPWPVAELVLQHHEKLDGTGYPRGLTGEALLPEVRILTVADVLEAESSFRPYRPARGIATALEELQRGRGTRYDATVVDACRRLFEEEGFGFN